MKEYYWVHHAEKIYSKKFVIFSKFSLDPELSHARANCCQDFQNIQIMAE